MQAGIGRQFQLGLLRVVEDALPRQLLGGINALRQRGRAMLQEASGQGSRQQFVLAGGKSVGDGVDQLFDGLAAQRGDFLRQGNVRLPQLRR